MDNDSTTIGPVTFEFEGYSEESMNQWMKEREAYSRGLDRGCIIGLVVAIFVVIIVIGIVY